VDVGDLVVGARSGPGEPEEPGAEVHPVGDAAPAAVPERPSEAPYTARPAAAAEGWDLATGGTPAAHGAGLPAMSDGGAGEPVGPVGPSDPDPADGGEDGEPPGHRGERRQRSFWKELPLLIGIALVLALLIKTFLVQAFSIPSDSMNDTLIKGDRVLVDKLTPWFGSEPTRGEVVSG
jgi:signal peptidase I